MMMKTIRKLNPASWLLLTLLVVLYCQFLIRKMMKALTRS
jgi:hypothetical protein